MTLLQPLTAKPVLFVANVDEGAHEVPEAIAEHAASVRAPPRSRSRRGSRPSSPSSTPEEADAMRADLGLQRIGPGARSCGAPSRCSN